jgi:threonine 3-dehydrogenase
LTRAVVTGTGGQIGSDLAPALVEAGFEIRLVDYLKPELVSGCHMLEAAFGADRRWRTEWWLQADANDRTAIRRLFKEFRPDVVFHLVALLSATSERSPAWAWQVNLGSLNVVIDILLELQGDDPGYRPVLVWPSSVAAYGVPVPGYPGDRVPEDYPMQPRTMYGATKLAGEALGVYYSQPSLYKAAKGGARPTLDFRALRFPGLLSATPPGGGSTDYANQIYFQAAGHTAKPLFVKRETRLPFLHMSDAVAALLTLAQAPEAGLKRRVYNVRAFAPTVDDFVASVRRHHPGFDVASAPDFRQAIVDSWPQDMDDSAARNDWGFSPRFDLDRTTDDLIAGIARYYPPEG